MVANKQNQCIASGLLGNHARTGALIEDSLVEGQYRDLSTIQKFNDWTSRLARDVSDAAIKRDPSALHARAAKTFEGTTGVSGQQIAQFFHKPNDMLGDDVVQPVLQRLQQFTQDNPTGGTLAQYKQQTSQFFDDFQAQTRETLKPELRHYFDNWVKTEKQGRSLFGLDATGKQHNPLKTLAGNAVANIVTNSPTIALWNVFELLPKAQVIAIDELGAVGGQRAIMQGIINFGKKAGAQFWKRIPELEQQGIYGRIDTDPIGQWLRNRFGVGNLLDITETPLRGLAHEIGEAIRPGLGPEAVERIAFSYRPGNVPQMLWNSENAGTVSLMRFSVESMKLYGGLFARLTDPKKRVGAAQALAAFHLINAIQSGTQGSLPDPVWQLLPPEQKEMFREFDKNAPLNIGGKLLDVNVAEATRPGLGFATNLGGQIFNSDIKGTGFAVKRGTQAFAEGDVAKAAQEYALAALTIGQVGRIPGVNNSTLRVAKAAKDEAENQGAFTVAGFTEALKERFGVEIE